MATSMPFALQIQARLAMVDFPPASDTAAATAMHTQILKAVHGNTAKPTGNAVDPYQQELELWNDAIQIDPRDSQAYLLRGDMLARAKHCDEALADYDRAAAIEPDNRLLVERRAQVLNLRAIGLKNQALWDRAIADYTEAIRLAPHFAPYYRNRAKTYFCQNDLERGFADLEQAYALSPENEAVCNDLAWHLATVSDPKWRDARRALDLARRSCQATSYGEPGRLDTLAVAHAALGEFDQAVHWLDQALALTARLSPTLREQLDQHRRQFLERRTFEE
jgi:tetratricopeptide (TPR) repeat protein